MTGCSLLVAVVAVLAAASAVPGPQQPLLSSSSETAGAGLTLAELAAAQGLVLPPRPAAPRLRATADQVDMESVQGAQNYPFGLADPLPPPRTSKRRAAASRRQRRDAGDDVYDESRLPTNVVPTRYTVKMAPNLDQGIFYGSTDIYLNVVEKTSRIALHGAPDLTMKEVQILKLNRQTNQYEGSGNATLRKLGYGEDLERIIVDLSQELEVGEHYLLRFPLFAAYLRDDLKGFYMSTYEDQYGNIVRIGTTQFEPPAARFAFPCFDEPELKARFKIIIEHDRALTARSNMPIVRVTQPALLTVTTEFDETLPMSTYLLAWVVSDFTYLSNKEGTFSTWGRSNLLSHTTAWLSQTVGPAALEGLKDFTGIPYALPKVDQFAIPDFEAGAMENWGLVTYREEYLLESDVTNIRIREFIATTVCHELGHQWTGNLVTLDWWSNTWLNEGFATYFESVICDKIIPEWKLMDKYVTDNVHVGIANDVIPGQLAMSSPVITLDGVEAKFDRISYKKGGAVLRMFENIMGTETFKKAMHRYLSANSFKNGSPDRLFRAMNAEINLLSESPLPESVDFATVAKTWTEQAGVPVVTAVRDYATSTVNLSQEKLTYVTPEEGEASPLWYVPLPAEVNPKSTDWTWNLNSAPANKRWLTPEAPSLTRDVEASETEWLVLNPRQIGYYLVNYDEANWKLLNTALASSPSTLHASTRTQLVHDALALARAGKLSYELALPFLKNLKAEREAAPWRAAVNALAFLRDRLTATPAGYALKAFIKDITADAFGEVGFTGVDSWDSYKDYSKDEERYLRYYLASYACSAGNAACASAAVTELNKYLEGNTLQADIKETALCYGVQNSAELFGKVLNLWKHAETSTEAAGHAAALACTLDHKLLANVLDGILNGDLNKSAFDLKQLIDAIIARWENHQFMIDYYKKNWKTIRTFANGNSYYFYLLASLIADVRTPEEYAEVKAFVVEIFPDETAVTRREAELRLQGAEKDLDWYRKHYASVSKWLFEQTGSRPQPITEPTGPTTERTRPTGVPPTRPTGAPKPTDATPEPSSTTAKTSGSQTLTGTLALLLAALLVRAAL